MDVNVLTPLWQYNRLFLERLAAFEPAAKELEGQGRPLLNRSLQAWRHDTEATNMLIQYVLNSRQAANPAPTRPAPPAQAVPVVQPAAMLDKQGLFGIWDMTGNDGRPSELALDDRNNFSFMQADDTFAFWGTWSFDANPGGRPFITVTRKSTYPMRYYGPRGSNELVYPETQTWAIAAAQGDTVSFGSISMLRRKGIALPMVTERVSEVQYKFQLADQHDRNRAAEIVNWNWNVASVQRTMWDYIDSGAGRYRG